MTRRFLAPAPLVAGAFDLPPDEARHLAVVLRAAPGDRVEATDGAGREADAVVVSLGRGAARLRTEGPVRDVPRPPPLELWAALPRAGGADDVVRVATELGATTIRPLRAERGVWRPSDDADGARSERFRKAAVAALKQCKGAWLPALPPAASPADLALGDGDVACFGSPAADAAPALAVVAAARGGRVVVLVGPEGGFTAEEERLLRERGARAARIGRHVLRVETAATALLAVVIAARDGGAS